MSLESTVQAMVEKIIQQQLPLFLTEGTVTVIDKVANTIDVDRDELPELLKVRLNAVLEAGTEVITVYPKVGAKVLCIMVENSTTDAYMLSTNNIEEIIINDGTNGGLIKIVSQTAKLNALIVELQAELVKIASGITGLGGVYAPGTLTQLNKADFENEKIKH